MKTKLLFFSLLFCLSCYNAQGENTISCNTDNNSRIEVCYMPSYHPTICYILHSGGAPLAISCVRQ